jgi:hypothetical protein
VPYDEALPNGIQRLTKNVFIIKIKTCGEFLHQLIKTVSITVHVIFFAIVWFLHEKLKKNVQTCPSPLHEIKQSVK